MKNIKEKGLKEMRCPNCNEAFLTEKQSKPYAKWLDRLLENKKKETLASVGKVIDELRDNGYIGDGLIILKQKLGIRGDGI